MNVFIANFGRENYEWPECRARGTIAVMNEVAAQALWVADDRDAYIALRMKGKTAAGIEPTRPVASRWFNLMTIISTSANDIWIHREKDELWWTISNPEPPTFVQKTEPVGDKLSVVICHKPCQPWSCRAKSGVPLTWASVHPKAREFLFTEGTLQQLSDDNAHYAKLLIDGGELSSWHSRPLWLQKAQKAGKAQVTHFDAKRRAAWRMADTACATASKANGQEILRTIKLKNFEFSDKDELINYIVMLIDLQDRTCALTDLPLQFDGDHDDSEMLASLDRIDSNGHYAKDNLQIVCRFANRWKGNDEDKNFRRLISSINLRFKGLY